MSPTTNSRLAGFAFLFYIAVGVTDMVLHARATAGSNSAEKLAGIAQHPGLMGFGVIAAFLTTLCAIVLGVTMYALTRGYDRDLAMLSMLCRVGEGITGAVTVASNRNLVWLATKASVTLNAVDAAALNAQASLLLHPQGFGIGASLFALGSTIYCYIFLRARTIPAVLAWLGFLGSLLITILLPLELAGFTRGTQWEWIPIALFEVAFAFWLLFKGVAAAPATRQTT